MTEEKFESRMEHLGDAIEKSAENAASVLDHSLDAALKYKSVRRTRNAFTILTGAGLIASAIPLRKKGYHKTAKACFIGGGFVIVTRIIEAAVFRNK